MTPTVTPDVGSIEGWVYHDRNGDLVFDAGDEALAGVFVDLTADHTVAMSTSTGADGYFLFSDLLPGFYDVRESAPSGWEPALPTDELSLEVTANFRHTLDFAHQPMPTSTPTPFYYYYFMPLFHR